MIPVFTPLIEQEEISNVVDALQRGEVSGNFGTYLDRFESDFAAFCGCKHGVATTSGTTALHLAVDAAGIRSGDEVLVSSSTNIATALGVIRNGAIPVPVDSENKTWNLNLDLLEGLISPRTKAIIPVHLFGHPVDMDELMAFANRHNLIVIEDCAESHGATVRGRMTGSFGHMGCFSFYANKVITTGEGGMVVTNDDRVAKQLRLLRNLGFTNPRFRHEVAGYNFRMTGFQAAIGLAQLHKIETIIDKKRRIARAYTERLRQIPGLQLPAELNWARNVYWMYALRILPEFGITRDELTEKLQVAGIETRTFFCPMNQQPCLQELVGFRADPCPVADQIWRDGLYLPSGTTLAEGEIQMVCDAIAGARA